LPRDLSIYQIVCEQFFSSGYEDWVSALLANRPHQLKIDFDKLIKLVNEFTLTRRIHILQENKTKFCGEPIINWLEIMHTLTAAGSDHLTNQLDLPQMLDLLNSKFSVFNFQKHKDAILSADSNVRIILN